MLKTNIIIVVALFAIIVGQSCKKEVYDVSQSDDMDCEGVVFDKDVKNIFATKCLACHIKGGIGPGDFMDFEIIKRDLEKIKQRVAAKTMPPTNSPQLSSEEIDQMITWIDCGGSFEGAVPEVPIEEPIDTTTNSTDTLIYNKDIKSIITGTPGNCVSCHNSLDTNRRDFNVEAKFKEVVDLGLLKKRVLVDKDMPQAGPLPADVRAKIQKWLDQGAKFE